MHVNQVAIAAKAEQSTITVAPRLVHAANEFEAQMMKELLKPMATGNALTGDGSDAEEGSEGVLGDFASESLGRALSEQGGMGIATSILRSLSHLGNPSTLHPRTGRLSKEQEKTTLNS
jgi:Rod binding domain-containing protein